MQIKHISNEDTWKLICDQELAIVFYDIDIECVEFFLVDYGTAGERIVRIACKNDDTTVPYFSGVN